MFKKKSLILILLLPVFLTSCARAQGALAPTGESSPAQESEQIDFAPDQFLPVVEPESLEPIINYVDGLNLALTGDFSPLRATALPGCGCLAIANRLENLFKSASLIGGSYKLASIKLEKDGQNQKSFKVIVDRSEIRRVDKFNHQSILWSASKISNTFIVKRSAGAWLLRDTK